jgi:hypothetical protein
MFRLILLLCLGATACSNAHSLAYTSDRDPVWQLNPTMWVAQQADLTPGSAFAPVRQAAAQ